MSALTVKLYEDQSDYDSQLRDAHLAILGINPYRYYLYYMHAWWHFSDYDWVMDDMEILECPPGPQHLDLLLQDIKLCEDSIEDLKSGWLLYPDHLIDDAIQEERYEIACSYESLNRWYPVV